MSALPKKTCARCALRIPSTSTRRMCHACARRERGKVLDKALENLTAYVFEEESNIIAMAAEDLEPLMVVVGPLGVAPNHATGVPVNVRATVLRVTAVNPAQGVRTYQVRVRRWDTDAMVDTWLMHSDRVLVDTKPD